MILYPITVLPQGTHTGTKRRWNQPNVPVDLCPLHCHHLHYTPINTPTLYYLPRARYQTHSSTYKTAYTDRPYNILIPHYITFW